MDDLRAQWTEKAVGANDPVEEDTINRLALVQHFMDGSHNTPLFMGSIVALMPNKFRVRYLKFINEQAAGVSGGSFSNGALNVMNMSLEEFDDDELGSLASNVISLSAGVYRFNFTVFGYGVGAFQIALTSLDWSKVFIGSSGYSVPASNISGFSFGSGRFTIVVDTDFHLLGVCSLGNLIDGQGLPVSLAVERYSFIEFYKE